MDRRSLLVGAAATSVAGLLPNPALPYVSAEPTLIPLAPLAERRWVVEFVCDGVAQSLGIGVDASDCRIERKRK